MFDSKIPSVDINLRNCFSCFEEMLRGSDCMIHFTPSVQGGYVSEPWYMKYLEANGGIIHAKGIGSTFAFRKGDRIFLTAVINGAKKGLSAGVT